MNAKVRTCLWFEKQAMEAVEFYVSLLPNSRIENIASFEHMLTGEENGVTVIEFTLAGTPYQAMYAGSHEAFNSFNTAMSISVMTKDQAETDRLWEALTANGGTPVQCGWLKDRYGISWQIVPDVVPRLVSSGGKEAVHRFLMAMKDMQKLDVAALERAHAGH